jgi:hypothetical protein
MAKAKENWKASGDVYFRPIIKGKGDSHKGYFVKDAKVAFAKYFPLMTGQKMAKNLDKVSPEEARVYFYAEL